MPVASTSTVKKHSHVDILILGAGPTGLGAARKLTKQNNQSWLMIDAADRAGGMAVTERDEQGFLWDMGGHVIHSHFDAFNDAINSHSDWVYPQRGGWVRVENAWCPTPIQRHLGNLKKGEQICQEINDIQAKGGSMADQDAKNLGEYFSKTFGPTLNDIFFTPFNSKQWAWPLDKLNHTWTSLRAGSKAANVPKPKSVVTSSDQPDDISNFPYPRLGTGDLWQSVARALPADKQRYNTYVTAIDLDEHIVTLDNGETVSYGHCISSLPLSVSIELVNAAKPNAAIPISLKPLLKHSSTTVVGLGFEGPLPKELEGRTWVFGADADVSFHRCTILTNFSPSLSEGENGSGSRWSVMFETASSEHRQIDIRPEVLAKQHLAELRRWGAVKEGQEPISTWSRHLHLGYPIPFLERDEVLLSDDNSSGIIQRFEKFGFVQRGRFGGWRYESSNQDYAFVQGYEAVDLIQTGAQESIYWPGRADKVTLPAAPVSNAIQSPTTASEVASAVGTQCLLPKTTESNGHNNQEQFQQNGGSLVHAQ